MNKHYNRTWATQKTKKENARQEVKVKERGLKKTESQENKEQDKRKTAGFCKGPQIKR